MKIVDIIINRFISRNLDDVTVNSSESPKENIRLYYRSQMKKQLQEKNLKSITETNLSPVDETENIQTLLYYKNRKVGNLFVKNKGSSLIMNGVVSGIPRKQLPERFLFADNKIKMARKPGKKQKENAVGCTGEGER